MVGIKHGNTELAREALMALLDKIQEAGMSVCIRNPGRLSGDWIRIDRDRIWESEIAVEGSR